MFEFDLQRFDEESTEQPTQSQPESSTEEEKPIPEELSGLPEDIARETLAEWEKSQPKPEEPQPQEEPPKPPTEESVPYARFKEKVDEANQLKAQIAEYQRQAQQQQQQPQQPQQPPQPQPQFQLPQFQITPEDAVKINEAITAEAMQLSGKKN